MYRLLLLEGPPRPSVQSLALALGESVEQSPSWNENRVDMFLQKYPNISKLFLTLSPETENFSQLINSLPRMAALTNFSLVFSFQADEQVLISLKQLQGNMKLHFTHVNKQIRLKRL
jgi:hypothetical protein